MKLGRARVTVVGLGLMGGSLAQALRGSCATLTGVDLDAASLALARRIGAVDEATSDLADGLRECDLAVLAVPVGGILSILRRLGGDLPTPRAVMDLGSTKEEIVRAMQGLPADINPIGGHPLCGKEQSGLEASDPLLFHGRTFVLTPLQRTPSWLLRCAQDLVEAVGARPLTLEPTAHDRLLAVTSHLPYLLAASLTAVAHKAAKDNPLLWKVTASGFHDTSRLAASEPTMMADILLSNCTWLTQATQEAIRLLETLQALVVAGDKQALLAALESIGSTRKHLSESIKEESEGHEPSH